MQFVVKTKADGSVYEISELIKSVKYTDRLNDGCSKLEFVYINDKLILQNSDILWFKYNDAEIFYGYVFKVSRSSKNEISVVAYDQLRYAKGKDYLYIKNNTLKDLVDKMCLHFNFTQGHIAAANYVLATQPFDGNTWLDIVYKGISETLQNTGIKYCLRDEFGKVTLRDMNDLRLNLVLGDESLCYDFSYEKSIDDDFYNQIVILAENKKSKGESETTVKIVGAKESDSIKKYGLMQYYEKMQNTNPAQAQAKADVLLQLYNREAETLTLDCLGDVRIRAGSSFYIYIDALKLNEQVYVKSVTHDYVPIHKMSVEVAL